MKPGASQGDQLYERVPWEAEHLDINSFQTFSARDSVAVSPMCGGCIPPLGEPGQAAVCKLKHRVGHD